MHSHKHKLYQTIWPGIYPAMTKDLQFQLRENATVATRDPSDPPNMNVGYERTWLRYRNGGSLPASSSFGVSCSWDIPILLWLKLSTSCTNSSFVLLHDVITYESTTMIIKKREHPVEYKNFENNFFKFSTKSWKHKATKCYNIKGNHNPSHGISIKMRHCPNYFVHVKETSRAWFQ